MTGRPKGGRSQNKKRVGRRAVAVASPFFFAGTRRAGMARLAGDGELRSPSEHSERGGGFPLVGV